MKQNIIERFLQIKDSKEKEILLDLTKKEKKKLEQLKDEDSFIRQTILDFIIIYNPLNSEWKNESVAYFCKKLIPFYDAGKNISIPILKLMDENFKKPSFLKIFIKFEKQINQEKAFLECCFKLILLTKNYENLVNGIKNYLRINNEFLFKHLEKIDNESPYANILLRRLIENLIAVDKNLTNEEIEQIYKEQVNNLTNYYHFLCPNCLQFQFIRYIQGKFIIICRAGHNYSDKIKNIKDLKYLSKFDIKCQTCDIKLELFERNFCCFQCNKFFCEMCSQKHKNDCLKFSLCKIYNCGFYCKIHNKKYIFFL